MKGGSKINAYKTKKLSIGGGIGTSFSAAIEESKKLENDQQTNKSSTNNTCAAAVPICGTKPKAFSN